MLNTVKERLIAYLDNKGVNKSEFGRRIGVSNAFVTSIRKSIQPDKIALIQKEFPDLNTSWLLTGEGEMLKPNGGMDERSVREIGRIYPVSSRDEEVSTVRFFQITPTATFQEFCGTDAEPERMPLIPPYGEIVDEDSCVFEIVGESMAPQIPNGATVLCREIKPSRWHSLTSGVVVIAYGNCFVIKRIITNHLASEDYLVIGSDNPNFPGEVCVPRADIRCIFEARQVLSFPIR